MKTLDKMFIVWFNNNVKKTTQQKVKKQKLSRLEVKLELKKYIK